MGIIRSIRKFLKFINSLLSKVLPLNLYIILLFYFSLLINLCTVNYISIKYNIKKMKELPFDKIKKSDTLFVLGSGNSINQITKEQWDIIGNHDSVGMNFWLIHDFVPSFYVYEESLKGDETSTFYEILSEKEKEYYNTPLLVKDLEYKGISVSKIPKNLLKNIYLSTEVSLPYDNADNLKAYTYKSLIETCKLNKQNLNVLLKIRGTLSYILLLALALKYKKIVLCGIDLINSKFFFNDKNFSDKKRPEKKLDDQTFHPTNIRTPHQLPMVEIVNIINNKLFKPRGIELYVSNDKSALRSSLDNYFNKTRQ